MKKNSELTLRKQNEFVKIYNNGKSKGSRYVVVLYKSNNKDYTRTAFVASKKVGNSVQRNRSRRLMREAYRKFEKRIAAGYDIIFIARNSINDVSEKEVEKSMFGAVRACGLLEK